MSSGASLGAAFQFTPLREGRPRFLEPISKHKNFNSRPSARGDFAVLITLVAQGYFNSRPSARGDSRRLPDCVTTVLFQFTPLREGRPLCDGVAVGGEHFNSRPSARGDDGFDTYIQRVGISIHAPPRGATIRSGSATVTAAFQFTPLREGRRVLLLPLIQGFFYFNSRPSARGDDNLKRSFGTADVFQFTPLREGRRLQSRCSAD